jgi:acetoin utilization deacetylase AcuC-like enzyme
MPILSQFQPDAIFVSCGFDCASNDPIGDSSITDQGFKTMTKFIKSLNKPILLAL